jgi:alpha-D-xyloside xylohydrolase
VRFGNGAWSMLPGVTPTYLAHVDAVRVADREVTLHVFSRLESARWATLAGHMFTVRITSPADNLLRIQVTHHQGRRQRHPQYELYSDPGPLKAEENERQVIVRAGGLKLIVTKHPWGVEFVDAASAELVTSSPFKAMGLMDKAGHGLFMREQLTLSVGEQVYGLGERFAALTRNGQTVDMEHSDCGTCSDKGYKDVPFFLTSRGWGVLVNSPAKVSFEIGTEQVMRAQFGVPGEDLDYFLIHGPSPKQVLTRLGVLVGRPALPPAWSFGLWLTTSFTTDYDEQTVMEHVRGMAERNVPLHVFHFDCFWMKAHHWCNFEWDRAVFPDPEGMLGRLQRQGLHICVWINPYIAERSRLFAEGCEHGYLLKRPTGDVYQRPKWQAGMGYVDFTNPAATRWYQDQLRRLLQMGVDTFKTDFGEEIPTDVVYHDGSDPELMHNYYTYLYNRAVFELLVEERGEGEALVFARSATATCQRFPVHWGGDCYGNYGSMAESLRGGLSLTMSGFGFWSHDIGGFEDKAPPGVYKRWVGFGLLSSHSRLHGSTSYRVPWLYDEESVDVVRQFTRLKCRLMPYLMVVALQAHTSSIPVMRAMVLEFPEDPTCRTLDRQYLLGDSLLVAPLFHDHRAEYYLPEGEWTHLLTGELRTGGRWYFDELGFLEMPLYVRPNGVVALGPELAKVDYDYAARVRLLCGKLDGTTQRRVQIVDSKGRPATQFLLEQHGRRVVVTNPDSRNDFQVQLPWTEQLSELVGGELVAASPDTERAPGDPPGGVLIAATASRVEFVWC